MSTQVESSASVGDVVKQVFSIVFVIAGLAGFYYFSEYSLLYRVLSLVVIVLIAMGLMLTTQVGQGFWAFALESKQEVRKVVWPTRQETMRTTLLVFAMVLVVGVILWLLDMFLFWGVRLLTGQGG
ncbi:preprotein translocase subunit SecE [Methylotuvimicrobium alcaliphilum]|jgi:preprotein translocase subunit SecE|uniref:Protein translocase subunit SecE n=1 Tax=Methylotuvimicrobium alcaliphilum (strain DSM 19304 / NCIMB 14124 / VKM B-2133 / 20Z) TaxID=1091494 RepID=G4STM8_META2|nr:preprotein translocase subunit SecE [Methylotuvimicrobium alcaliphilum]CCE25029.1 Preprotein translocase subunit SecE [Methylotuvimicrobium alcaliphilum 20Z]